MDTTTKHKSLKALQNQTAALAKGSKHKGMSGHGCSVLYIKGTRSGRQHQHLSGIYKRIGFVQGSAIKPIMMFIREPSYPKRFPFNKTVQKVINQRLMPNFNDSMREALLTPKRTG